MKKLIAVLPLLFCFATDAAQSQFESRTAYRLRYGSSTPSTCSVGSGDVFFKTSATIGIYYCSAADTWTFASTGSIAISGTPVDNQLAIWTAADTQEGDTNLVWDGSTLAVTGNLTLSTDLTVANGGTGASSFTDGGILLGSDTGAFTALGAATNGQIPIGDGTTDPVLATITAVANETDVTNGSGTITIGLPNDVNITGTVNLNSGGGDDDGTWQGNNNANLFTLDAGLDSLGLGANVIAGSFLALTPGAQSRTLVTSVGAGIHYPAETFTDAGATDPLAITAGTYLGIPTFSHASKVYTEATNLYIAGAAAVTGGGSMTNPYALWVDAGAVRLDGALTIGTTATFTEFNMGTVGSTETLNWNNGNKQRATLDENLTFTFTDPVGPTNLVLFLKQDGAGTNTVTWPASVKWAGGTAPTISSGASAEDIISCYFNGTNYYCAEVQNFS